LRFWDTEYDKELSLNTVVLREDKSLVYETDGFVVLDVVVEAAIPDAFYIAQNYPNPFNAVTKISYGLPEASHMSICIYDISGRLVATLVESDIPAGCHAVNWETGYVATGVYLVRMEASSFSAVRKVALVR